MASLTNRIETIEEAVGGRAGRCPRHLWVIVEVPEGQGWTGTKGRCNCGAPAGLVLMEVPRDIKPSPCRQSVLGTREAALGVLSDAELDAVEAVVKREGEAETEGEAKAIARWNHVADLLSGAEAAGGELVVRMPAPLAAVAMPRYTALRQA